MKTFKDELNREWSITITVGVLKRIRELTEVNLLDAFGDAMGNKLVSDVILLVDVLYAACRPEAETRGISDEQFGEALYGDAIDHATTALLGAITDFFPNRKAEVMRAGLQKMDDAQNRILQAARKKIDDPKWEEELQRAIDNM